MLSQIVTMESKRGFRNSLLIRINKSMEWRYTQSPVKVKNKQTLSQRKIMASVFCWSTSWYDHKSLLPNPRKLRRAIQNKRRGMLTNGILLLHDNARPHTAAQTQAVLDSFDWGSFGPHTLQPWPCAEQLSSLPSFQTHFGGSRYDEMKKYILDVEHFKSICWRPGAWNYDLGVFECQMKAKIVIWFCIFVDIEMPQPQL